MEGWIQQNSQNAISLEDIYFSQEARGKAYQLISNKIRSSLDDYDLIFVVLYGHPVFLSSITTLASSKLKEEGVDTHILPGISAFDCLMSDLQIDPIHGCMIVDSSILISKEKKIDQTNHIVITQLAVTLTKKSIDIPIGDREMNLFKDYLLKYYSGDHEFIVYEASLYPHQPPKIIKSTIGELNVNMVSTISTGYIPPIQSE